MPTYLSSIFPEVFEIDPLSPGEEELSHLLQYKIRYHLVVPEMLKYEQVRLNLSQWEEDIITTWNRDKKINDIFK
jgi:hypothetical protein